MQSLSNFKQPTVVAKHLLQSALFSASNKIPSGKKVSQQFETYEGEQLEIFGEPQKQLDLAISFAYKQILNNAQQFGSAKFSLSDFAKHLMRKDGGKTRQYIIEGLRKNRELIFSIENKEGLSFEGNRLIDFSEEAFGQFKVEFNQDYMQFAYVEKNICHIDLNIFFSIPLGLCSWLYGFMCAAPLHTQHHVDELHKLSGSNYKNSHDFRKMLKVALRTLELKHVIHHCWGIRRNGDVFWRFNPVCPIVRDAGV